MGTDDRSLTPLRLDDWYAMTFLRDPQLSPDGQRVAYVVQSVRSKEDDRVDSLYMSAMTPGPAHRMTRGATHDNHPRWSPDGRYLAFLSTRPHEMEVAAQPGGAPGQDPADSSDPGSAEEPKAQIWVFDLHVGGEPRQLTARAEGVETFAWSPDSRQLVFQSRDPSPDQTRYLTALRHKKTPGPRVIERVQHKQDGEGYLDDVPTHLFIVDAPSREVSPLTTGHASERDPVWSPDGRFILFASNRTGNADNNNRTDLWLIRPDGTDARRVTFGDVGASGAAFSPDSREIAFLSSREPESGYVLTHVMLVAVSDSEPVPDLAACIGRGWSSLGGTVADEVVGDPVLHARVYPVPTRATPVRILTEGIPGPAMGSVKWDGSDTILVMAGDHGQWRLLAVSPRSGHWRFGLPDDRLASLEGFDVARGRLVVQMNRPHTGAELYSAALDHADPLPLTTWHQALMTSRQHPSYQWVRFVNPDGDAVEGLLATPPGFVVGGPPMPLVVSIHGGPMAFDAPSFQFDEQYLADLGYLVLMVNYRGSISYGEEFCRVIQGDWGPREHADVMAGVDYVVRQGWADPDRLYCTGFSQGGIMTNWAVGHTDRFRAAVSEHGMWDYVAAYGTDDCHLWWQDDLGVPWQNPEAYRRISPMSGVAHIHTPLLITAGELDWRCPLNQAEQLYLSLKKRGVPTALVVYPGEHHAITRPSRAVDRMRRMAQWFSRYGGLPIPEADAEKPVTER